jgi:hypothetical protein
MKKKSLSGLKIVDEAEGTVKAVFSTFNVIDHDNDVTLPGAFEEGAKVRISAYNHASWGAGHLPVGKGTIHSDESRAYLNGQFFLNTQHGKDTFETVKELDDLGEWSYGYEIVDSDKGQKDGQDVRFLKKLKVPEVSPVLLGAGIDTRTLIAKGLLPEGVILDEVDALVKALQEHDPEEVAKALSQFNPNTFIDHLAGLTTELKVINDRVADERRTGKDMSDEDREAVAALESEFAKLRDRFVQPSVKTEIRKAQRTLARASLILSQTHQEEEA